MNEQIKNGQAPKDVEFIHNVNTSVKGSKIHVHFKDETCLNIDGTIHDSKRGIPRVSRKTREWLEKYVWKVPNIYRR